MHRVGMILITAMLVMMLFAPAASAETTHLYYDSDSGTPISASITTNVNLESTYSSNQRYYTLLSTSDNEGSTRTRWRNFNTGPMNPVLTLVNSTAYSQDTLITGISGKFRVRGSSSVPAFYVRIIDFSDSGEVVLGIAGPLYGSSTSNDAILTFDLSSITGTIPVGNKLGMQVIVDNGGTNWRFYGNAGSTGTTMDFYVEETPVVKGPSVSVTLTPSAQSVDPGNQVQYTVTVDNTGNVSDTFSLSLDNANTADFSYSLASSTTGSLAPAGQYVTTMIVTAAGGATRGNSHGQTVSAIGSSSSGTSDSVTTSVATFDKIYRWISDGGTTVATGVTTDWTTCGLNSRTGAISLLTDGVTSGCNADDVSIDGAGTITEMFFDTAYTEDTNVTGNWYQTTITQGGPTATTYTFSLIYAHPNGTIGVLPGTGSLSSITQTAKTNYNVSLTGIFGTVPAGAKLGVRIAKDQTWDTRVLYFGDANNAAGTGPTGYFSVTETPIATPTYDVTVTPSPTSAGVIAGGSAVYTITVNNNGNTAGNYNLVPSDSNAGDFFISTLAVSPIAVAAGGSAQTTLTVTANGDASAGANDITTVTATCVEDSAYTGSGQVITTVQDNTAPTIVSVTLNTTTPNIGDYVLVTVNTTDDTAVTDVLANGVSLSNVGGNIWEGTIVAIGGTQSVNVSSSDAVPNTAWDNATIYTATTPDTTAPTIVSVTLNTSTPNTGDNVLVTVNTTDDTAVTDVLANGVSLSNVGGNIWEGTIVAIGGTQSVNVSSSDAVPNTAWDNATTYTATTSDTIAPVITLLGATPVTIVVGSVYTDAGASAFDTNDGDLNSSIVTVNPVDNTIIGTYTVTYNVNDSSNNAATEVQRKVVVSGLGEVKGIVRDSVTGFGIAGAIVSTNTSITKTTDANGFYSMVLDAGTYNLTVIRDPVYYSNSSVTIDISVPHLEQDVVLTLKPAGSITGTVTD